ncbi:MAG: hypothetical protein CMB99_01220 [Flavobacteriaceae bacterium]|nr:hypothetical protein [Flavobacteriaceae bacterium]
MRVLPDGIVHHITTSPPYWALRDYGVASSWWGGDKDCTHVPSKALLGRRAGRHDKGHSCDREVSSRARVNAASTPSAGCFCQKCNAWHGALGLEPDPKLFAYHLIIVLRECRRILHKSGTMLLNLGDSFYGPSPVRAGRSASQGDMFPGAAETNRVLRETTETHDMKTKDRVFLPHLVAMHMRQPWVRCDECGDEEHLMWWGQLPSGTKVCPRCEQPTTFKVVEQGWWMRMDNVWAKRNCMPDPTKDRPRAAHEFVFLCSKSPRYFWDGDAVMEPDNSGGKRALWSVWRIALASARWDYCLACCTWYEGPDRKFIKKRTYHAKEKDAEVTERTCPTCKATDQWVDHFAMFPDRLPEIGILGGTSAHGACAECLAPWERVIELEGETTGRHKKQAAFAGDRGIRPSGGGTYLPKAVEVAKRHFKGWRPTCKCDTTDVVPCLVADPFNGSGTTILVAKRLQRRGLGFELNPSFVKLTEHRMAAEFPMGDLIATAPARSEPLGPPGGAP